MAITRLQRRQKKNRLNSIKKQQIIKDLLSRPVIKNIDVEALRSEFEKKNVIVEKEEKVAEKKTVKKTATKTKETVKKTTKSKAQEEK